MATHPEHWTFNTLRRTTGQAFQTLQRARRREIEYPSVKTTRPTIQEAAGHTALDDAFSSVMQSLSTASRNCLRYYRSSPSTDMNKYDTRFCARYLTPKANRRKMNPLQEEDVQIVVAPGTYSVTAAALGEHKPSQQTHVVKVGKGETATVDFTI